MLSKKKKPTKRAEKRPRTVGEWFVVGLKHTAPDTGRVLGEVAHMTTVAENACFQEWLKHDPWKVADAMLARRTYRETKKKTPIPAYPLGLWSSTIFCKELCPGLHSAVYDAIANYTRLRYHGRFTGRIQILSCEQRLPQANVKTSPRIRFRGDKCASVERRIDTHGIERFDLVVRLYRAGEPVRLPLQTRGKTAYCMRWLRRMADGIEPVPTGTISRKKHKGKLEWQVSLSREREVGEKEQVERAVPGRRLLVWAPLNQEVWLRCEVHPVHGTPWRMDVECEQLIQTKRGMEEKRKRLGRVYAQSKEQCAAVGHGRKRAIQGKAKSSRRYDNSVESMCHNRAKAIVAFAVRAKCEGIDIEPLSKRDPTMLRSGTFPYDRLMGCIATKAKDAQVAYRELDTDETRKRLAI